MMSICHASARQEMVQLEKSAREQEEHQRATNARSHDAPPDAAAGSGTANGGRPTQSPQPEGALPKPIDAIGEDTLARRGEDDGAGFGSTTAHLPYGFDIYDNHMRPSTQPTCGRKSMESE